MERHLGIKDFSVQSIDVTDVYNKGKEFLYPKTPERKFLDREIEYIYTHGA